MPQSRQEIRSHEFECSRLDDIADVHLTYLIHVEPRSEAIAGFECDQCKECGVAMRDGNSYRYDWHKCVHPKAPRLR